MTLAVTHLSPGVAVTIASAIILAMAWYWPRLARAEVSVAHRRVRRASLVLGLVGLIGATLGFGIIDPDATPVPYMVAWGAASLAIFGVVMLALLDALISLRLHRAAMGETRRRSAESLARALREAKSQRPGEGP